MAKTSSKMLKFSGLFINLGTRDCEMPRWQENANDRKKPLFSLHKEKAFTDTHILVTRAYQMATTSLKMLKTLWIVNQFWRRKCEVPWWQATCDWSKTVTKCSSDLHCFPTTPSPAFHSTLKRSTPTVFAAYLQAPRNRSSPQENIAYNIFCKKTLHLLLSSSVISATNAAKREAYNCVVLPCFLKQ